MTLLKLCIFQGQLSMNTKSSRVSSRHREESAAEATDSEEETDLGSERTSDLTQPKKKDIQQELEQTKFQVLEKIKFLEGINEELRKDYVPMTVINNLSNSVKGVEV